jgi:hypothetical protein
MSRRVARCKSCGAEILWTVTDGGRVMPVDLHPDPSGNQAIWPATDQKGRKVWRSRMVWPGDDMPDEVLSSRPPGPERSARILRVPHFVTCPNASKHRKRGR